MKPQLNTTTLDIVFEEGMKCLKETINYSNGWITVRFFELKGTMKIPFKVIRQWNG